MNVQVPSREVDKGETRFWSHWNKETKEFFLQFSFKQDQSRSAARPAPPPAMAPAPPRPPTSGLPPPPQPPGQAPLPPSN